MTQDLTENQKAILERRFPGRIPKVICLLIEQQLEMLKSRFPDCEYMTAECSGTHWLRLEISEEGTVLLIASFSPSSIKSDHTAGFPNLTIL